MYELAPVVTFLLVCNLTALLQVDLIKKHFWYISISGLMYTVIKTIHDRLNSIQLNHEEYVANQILESFAEQTAQNDNLLREYNSIKSSRIFFIFTSLYGLFYLVVTPFAGYNYVLFDTKLIHDVIFVVINLVSCWLFVSCLLLIFKSLFGGYMIKKGFEGLLLVETNYSAITIILTIFLVVITMVPTMVFASTVVNPLTAKMELIYKLATILILVSPFIFSVIAASIMRVRIVIYQKTILKQIQIQLELQTHSP